MQRRRPKTVILPGFRLLDLEGVQNTKDFALFSGRVGDILWLFTLKDRLSRILHFYFRVFSYDLEISECIGNNARYTGTRPAICRTKKVLLFIYDFFG